tara:strand:+ start:39 stop:893 length:855 start_codon:yes stop_codon:yes gene_type:complete
MTRKRSKRKTRGSNQKFLRECIIVGGKASGGHILGKTRDRNYVPRVRVIRELTPEGLEIVYMHDMDTDYMEGMNSNGIGIVNAALLVGDDEKAVKGKTVSDDGPRMKHALKKGKLSDCIKSLVSYKNGIKGHTMVGSPKSLYSIEMTSKHNPVVTKMDPDSGYDVRTNHGEEHSGAGYTPERKPDDYLSSKIRKATAEMELADESDFENIMPKLAKQNFDSGSNYNMLRATDNMRTASQVMMHLDKMEFILYLVPDECEYLGFQDDTPDDYSPKINVRIEKYEE